ncbi:MAG: hypothetical protein WCJ39_01600 [bacterium]
MKTTKHLLLVAIAIMVNTTFAQTPTTPKKEGWRLFGTFNFEVAGQANSSSLGFKEIPLAIRDVPKHPSDNYVSSTNMAPIEVSRLDESKLWGTTPSISLSGGIRTKKVEIVIGGFGSLNLTSQSSTERNYTNSPGTSNRSTGAALTYIKLNDLRWLYGYSGGLKIKVDESNAGIYLCILYQKTLQNMSIRTGWDRFDQLEEYNKYSLGTFATDEFSIGPEIRYETNGYIKIVMGYGITSASNRSAWAQDMNISTPGYIFLKLSLGIRVDTNTK